MMNGKHAPEIGVPTRFLFEIAQGLRMISHHDLKKNYLGLEFCCPGGHI